MSSSKVSVESVSHTPGPWKYHDSGAMVMTDDGKMVIADIRGFGPLEVKFGTSQAIKIMDANGRLIAAVHELLEACQAFLEADNQCGINLAFVMAQEAVKKAGFAPKENGGETCDIKDGPCACGAWHQPENVKQGPVVDKNGVEIKAGQSVWVHKGTGKCQAVVVTPFPNDETSNAPGHWVEVQIGRLGTEALPSYILEVMG